MIVVFAIVSLYLLIGILITMFMVYTARKYQLNISVDIVVLGILSWILSFPEFCRLMWSTLKLAYWKEKTRRNYNQMVREKKKPDKMIEKFEREVLK